VRRALGLRIVNWIHRAEDAGLPSPGPAVLGKAKPCKRNRANAEPRPNVGQKPAIVTPTRRKKLKLVLAELAASGDREVSPKVRRSLHRMSWPGTALPPDTFE
jgi:hypothetical protein